MSDDVELIAAELLEVAAENAGKWVVVCGRRLVGSDDNPVFDTYDDAVAAARSAERAAQERGERCVAFIGQVPP